MTLLSSNSLLSDNEVHAHNMGPSVMLADEYQLIVPFAYHL